MRAALMFLAACSLEPQVGAPLREACSSVDSDPDHDVAFREQILDGIMVEYHCKKCHTADGPTPIGLIVGGLDLSNYDSLRAGGARSLTNIVIPGMPCSSVLLQKLGAGPPFGSRMPLDGPPYLDDGDLLVISDWIVEGAHDN